jgi:hypothetical protein
MSYLGYVIWDLASQQSTFCNFLPYAFALDVGITALQCRCGVHVKFISQLVESTSLAALLISSTKHKMFLEIKSLSTTYAVFPVTRAQASKDFIPNSLTSLSLDLNVGK